jgi:hypothetical protein
LARARGPEAIRKLTELMRTAEPSVAWRCAVALLDRGYGRPVTSLEADVHVAASPPATAMSWHDQLLARAMMRLPDRVTGWPPLLPERGHELECFREDLAHLDPQGRISLRRSSMPSKRRSPRPGRPDRSLEDVRFGRHLAAICPTISSMSRPVGPVTA